MEGRDNPGDSYDNGVEEGKWRVGEIHLGHSDEENGSLSKSPIERFRMRYGLNWHEKYKSQKESK